MFCLRFIAGPRAGEHLIVPDEGEMIVGRTEEAQVVVPEEMVSRRHARLVSAAGGLLLTDLGSTNGTFVNGEKISESALSLDDRILVGSSVIQITDRAGLAVPQAAAVISRAPRRADQTAAFRGRLEQVPLADVLQLLARGQKTGTLHLTGPQPAKVDMIAGALTRIEVSAHPAWAPDKALSRLLELTQGTFEFATLALPAAPSPPLSSAGLEAQLLEAARQRDEAAAKRAAWPEGRGALALRVPLVPRLRDLTARELDLLQAALEAPSVDALLDREPGADGPVIVTLFNLFNAGYLVARAADGRGAAAAPPRPQETAAQAPAAAELPAADSPAAQPPSAAPSDTAAPEDLVAPKGPSPTS